MNSTVVSKGLYSTTFNMLRYMIIDKDLPMGGNKSTLQIKAQLRLCYDHDVLIHRQHSRNIKRHD